MTDLGWKMSSEIEVDYLIVGAGAVGLAFADTIISESDCTVAIVDRNGQPGGHWNDAYDFVRLHQPSEFYGVNSVPLGSGQKDQDGLNKGYYELASGSEVRSYFDQVVHLHLLPTGRVQYFPMSEYQGGGRFKSLLSGDTTTVKVHRKTVDATYYGTTVPSKHTRSFGVADGQQVVAPNALSELLQDGAQAWDRYCVLGGGKTGMDVGVWLQEAGASADAISWVVPRDAWLLNRKHVQPGSEFFYDTIGMQAKQLEVIAGAGSVDDLFARMEQTGQMLRIDQSRTPDMYHCATASEAEVNLLRGIDDVIRMGHVKSIDASGMRLAGGFHPMPSNTLYIDCTASAVQRRPSVPIFQDTMVVPQMVRTCQPTFSAAIAAHVELTISDTVRANELCTVLPLPDTVEDFLPLTLADMVNQYQWMRNRDIRQWLLVSRLDGFSNVIAAVEAHEDDKIAVLSQYRDNTLPAIGNIQNLMAKSNKA